MGVVAELAAHRRAVNLAAALSCAGLILYALYLQHFQDLEPCPLCMFQRVGIAAIGVAFLVAALPADRHRVLRIGSSLLVGIAALATAGVAIRHLYIQSQPAGSVPACGATLDYMMEVFGLTYVLKKVLTGAGECAKIDWTFLGLSMPAWVLAWALLLGLVGVLANWPRARRRQSGGWQV